jgi:hypothetical protein
VFRGELGFPKALRGARQLAQQHCVGGDQSGAFGELARGAEQGQGRAVVLLDRDPRAQYLEPQLCFARCLRGGGLRERSQ